ncbi:glycosyltransferase, partial [Chryseobacterium sp. SIMBA_029]
MVCVSRFVKRKNIDLLIEAFWRSGVHAAGLSLVLVGQGPCSAEIRKAIAQRDMNDRVKILGCVANRDMPAIYSLAEFAV